MSVESKFLCKVLAEIYLHVCTCIVGGKEIEFFQEKFQNLSTVASFFVVMVASVQVYISGI